jgi:hypothetical protein
MRVQLLLRYPRVLLRYPRGQRLAGQKVSVGALALYARRSQASARVILVPSHNPGECEYLARVALWRVQWQAQPRPRVERASRPGTELGGDHDN